VSRAVESSIIAAVLSVLGNGSRTAKVLQILCDLCHWLVSQNLLNAGKMEEDEELLESRFSLLI